MRQIRQWFARRTSLILLVCGVFLAGLLAARYGVRVPLWFGLLLGAAGAAAYKKPVARTILLCSAALACGVARGGAYYDALVPYRELSKQPVTVRATLMADAIYAENGQLSFTAGDVEFTAPVQRHTYGQINVKGYGELALYKGDRVEVQAKLYPTRGAAQASLGFAEIHRVGGSQSWIDELRRRFAAGMFTALPEPIASFGLGLLVGQRNTLPDDVTQTLKMVGLTHIIAVSGYNLTILLNAARRAFGKRSKLLAAASAVVLMLGFIAMTGASASIVRAVVVSSLSLAAWYVGRRPRPLVIILLAAAITAGWNPIYLWSDIGWYLSFLAFFGVLVIAPQVLVRIWPRRQAPLLAAMAVETLAAELMTIPLIMMVFGQLSLVGLLANLLVAALIPFAMALAFIAGLAGMLVPLAAGWVAWPARLLLTYMLDVAAVLSRIPHSFLQGRYLTAWQLVLCYGAILLVAVLLHRPRRQRWLKLLAGLPKYRDTQNRPNDLA